MSTEAFPYKSVHEYLDDVLSSVSNPSYEQIKLTKLDYWKCYYTHYRKQKRKTRKEFTLGFDKERLKLINDKKGTLTVSKFLYLIIDRELESNDVIFNDKEQLSELYLLLMKLISSVEELLDNDASKSVTEILYRLENLEETFSQFINP